MTQQCVKVFAFNVKPSEHYSLSVASTKCAVHFAPHRSCFMYWHTLDLFMSAIASDAVQKFFPDLNSDTIFVFKISYI
jgi:hypothetical protein